jgi:methylmalonyl-CoA mutase
MGGMTKAVASGMPKLRIEEAAATRQAMIDRGDEVIVGVNKYRLEKEDEIDILDVDNVAVREAQVARLTQIRETRDETACQAALAALTDMAEGEGNLLAAAVEAARARATVGEISMAMEKAFGRHRAEVKTLAGVYGAAYEGDEGFAAIQADVETFAEEEGRRPRMLVVKMGQDGHDRGAKVIATAFADIGFDVDVGPLFQTPDEAAQDAIDNDVHVIGISSQAAGHKTLAPQLVEEIFEIVKNLNEKEGVSILLAEQNTNVALRYAHYGFILESGRVVMDGPAAELRENPDVKEFYLGMSEQGRKSFRDVRSYRRRKRWLS